MIKVLNILTDSNIGGAGKYLLNYLRHYDRSQFSVTVVLPKGSALIPELANTPVIEVDGIAERSFSLSAIGALKKIIRNELPDLVPTLGSLRGRIAARQCGVKVIYTRHSAFPVPGYLKKGPGHLINGLINNHYADHIIAVSPACEANLLDGGIDPSKITALMNGVSPCQRATPERCQQLREQMAIPRVFTAGILARLEPYKGHMLLLEAAQILKSQGRDFCILIAGSGSEETQIKQEISRLQLEDCVRFLGFVENVSEILSLLDVQLNCSWGTEASSMALLEGMSMGLVSVASDYGGNPWQVDNGETGLLFPSGDSTALACCLTQLIDHPDQLAAMSKKTLLAYRSRFTGEIFAQNIESVYFHTLQKK